MIDTTFEEPHSGQTRFFFFRDRPRRNILRGMVLLLVFRLSESEYYKIIYHEGLSVANQEETTNITTKDTKNTKFTIKNYIQILRDLRDLRG